MYEEDTEMKPGIVHSVILLVYYALPPFLKLDPRPPHFGFPSPLYLASGLVWWESWHQVVLCHKQWAEVHSLWWGGGRNEATAEAES